MGVILEVANQTHIPKSEFLFHSSIKYDIRVEVENLSNLLSIYHVPCLGSSKMVQIRIMFILERQEQQQQQIRSQRYKYHKEKIKYSNRKKKQTWVIE